MAYFKSYAANEKLSMRPFLLPSPDAAKTPVPHFYRSMLALLLALAMLAPAYAQTESPSMTATPVASPIAATPIAASVAPTPMAVVRALRIPLTIDYLALSAAMRQQLYTDNGRAPIWNGTDRCQYFYAENPRFARAGNNLKLETDGTLMIGLLVGSTCVSPIQWKGIIEVDTAPYVAPKTQLKFHVSDINLYDEHHQKTLLVGKGFDLIKSHYIPLLETFTFDLSPAFDQFQELVKAGAPPDVTERVAQTLATLKVEPELHAEDNGIRAVIDLTMPAFEPIPEPSAPVQLTPQELAAFEQKLDQWDSFLVFAIKQMGEVSKDTQLRDDLLAVLLDSRHRLVDALAHPQSGGPDPIRILFLDEWQQLGQIIREAAKRGTLGSQALQFLSFMSAGDALFALDQAAPALGVRISSDDLRRLAKMIAANSTADPLQFNFDEDPTLRKMFHVQEPLSSEGPLDTESNLVETATPSASPQASPMPSESETPVPSASSSPAPANSETPSTPTSEPSVEVTPTPAPVSLWQIPLWLMTPNDADAAEPKPAKIDVVAKLQDLAKKLKRVVVSPNNASEYRGNYDALLKYGAQHEIDQENIDYRFRPLYLRLVKSAAWQESCWRQFVIEGNRITFLESSTHDIGLMQVNKYVWRGFYNIERLQWDVLYNASAGMEILARLLGSIQDKRGAFSPSNPDELARSIYAAYNGGPSSYRRWRAKEPKPLRHIDSAFWEKYQAVQHGDQIDILSCASEWGSDH